MTTSRLALCAIPALLAGCAAPSHPPDMSHGPVADSVIARQNAMLASNTAGKGFGPQSPRDIDAVAGNNTRAFSMAPSHTSMNLCNIHFHANAEHKGGEFSKYAGNGDGKGSQTGYVYTGQLSAAERKPLDAPVCAGAHGGLVSGDTIEVHYVHTTSQVTPGPTLGACLSPQILNPQLRVETQVMVLVNDSNAQNFGTLAQHALRNGLHQAPNIPSNMGTPVQYTGSTTGPAYNETASLLHVTWSVRPKVAKVDIASVGAWCKSNAFNENHAHGARNLVTSPDLLSAIAR